MPPSQAPFVAWAKGIRGGGASQAARRAPPEKEQQNNDEGVRQTSKGAAEWQAIIADLTSIKEGLKKEGGRNAQPIEELEQVITCVLYALSIILAV